MVTRARFNTLVKRFGMVPIRKNARRFSRLLQEPAPNCFVNAPTRGIGCNDAFLRVVTEEEVIFTLGHEAGHIIHGHDGTPRTDWREIQADAAGLVNITLATRNTDVFSPFILDTSTLDSKQLT